MAGMREGEIVRFKKRVDQVPREALGIVMAVPEEKGGACTILAKRGEVTCDRTAVSVLAYQDATPAPCRLLLPYGTRTRSDGTVIIFNRDYNYLWRISPDGRWKTAVPWDKDATGVQDWFPEWKAWPDAWRHDEAIASLKARLTAYGITGRPFLWEAIKAATFAIPTDMKNVNMVYSMESAILKTMPPSATARAALAA